MRRRKQFSALILTVFLFGCGAGCNSAPQPISDVPDYGAEDNWKCSNLSFDKYAIDNESHSDTMKEYLCDYKGKQISMYQLYLSSYSYSGGTDDSNDSVDTSTDAITASDWYIDACLSDFTSQKVDFTLGDVKDSTEYGIYTSEISANLNNEKYVGYWVEQTSTDSHLWIVKEEDRELIDKIFGTLAVID